MPNRRFKLLLYSSELRFDLQPPSLSDLAKSNGGKVE